jgi:2-phospho-L-lactate guanylyltransferase
VDLVIPMKTLDRAKTRLYGAADHGDGDRAAHEALALALVRDTVAAAVSTESVRRVLVVTSDPTVAAALAADGVRTVPDPGAGLNAAYTSGATVLAGQDPAGVVGALQADLPALRPDELAAALAEADGRRAFCADRQGAGTTLLLGAPGAALDPRFGPGSARAHAESGAVAIGTGLPSLRCDVDTAEDLAIAAALGLGPHTAAIAATPAPVPVAVACGCRRR